MTAASEMAAKTAPETKENFADLLDETLGDEGFEGKVVKGTVLSVDGDAALIDVGLKSEGRVPLKEFGAPGQDQVINIGDTIDVFVERYEDREGMIRLSREKARREEAWTDLEKSFKANERVNGVIFGRVKGAEVIVRAVELDDCLPLLPIFSHALVAFRRRLRTRACARARARGHRRCSLA